jgi:3-methyladenine DNA glycosylase AlkD
MMTVAEIMTELQSHGSESIKKILLKHGIKEPFFGVKIEYLKVIQRKVKTDYRLSLDLYATGNADAMYLAGLIAADEQMTKTDLNTWVKQAVSNNISEYTVPWVAAEGRYGFELALEWIDSPEEHVAAAGWSTLNNLIALKPDYLLDLKALQKLLLRVAKTIHTAPNRVRNSMNSFIIAAGSYINLLTDDAIAAAKDIGEVTVDMNGTSCKVPDAVSYINKNISKGMKKKKTVKC